MKYYKYVFNVMSKTDVQIDQREIWAMNIDEAKRGIKLRYSGNVSFVCLGCISVKEEDGCLYLTNDAMQFQKDFSHDK